MKQPKAEQQPKRSSKRRLAEGHAALSKPDGRRNKAAQQTAQQEQDQQQKAQHAEDLQQKAQQEQDPQQKAQQEQEPQQQAQEEQQQQPLPKPQEPEALQGSFQHPFLPCRFSNQFSSEEFSRRSSAPPLHRWSLADLPSSDGLGAEADSEAREELVHDSSSSSTRLPASVSDSAASLSGSLSGSASTALSTTSTCCSRSRYRACSDSDVDGDAGWNPRTTTIMLRNVPDRLTAEMLLLLIILQGFGMGCFDYYYLVMDWSRRHHRGYAFINFTTAELACEFRRRFHLKILDTANRKGVPKPFIVATAKEQGFDQCAKAYLAKKSGGQEVRNPWFTPWMFVRVASTGDPASLWVCLPVTRENIAGDIAIKAEMEDQVRRFLNGEDDMTDDELD